MSVSGSSRIVRYPPPLGLSKLFKPLPKRGARDSLDVHYDLPNLKMRFSARRALGIPEQTLLLVLVELAAEQHADCPQETLVGNGTTDPLSLILWKTLHQHQPSDGETLRISTSWYSLNQRVGAKQGGQSNHQRQEHLERLCEVVVWEEVKHADGRPKCKRQSFLVSWKLGDDHQIHMILNQRLAASLLGEQHVQISLHERFQLKTDVARALHAFLSAMLKPGRPHKIGHKVLRDRFWPSQVETPASTQRSQRKQLNDAFKEIAKLSGWSVTFQVGARGQELAVVTRQMYTQKTRFDKEAHSSVTTPSTKGPRHLKVCTRESEIKPSDLSEIFLRNTSD